jgi:hypothetical protein
LAPAAPTKSCCCCSSALLLPRGFARRRRANGRSPAAWETKQEEAEGPSPCRPASQRAERAEPLLRLTLGGRVEEGGGSLGGRRQIRRPRARLASPGCCGATGEGAAGAGRRPPLRRRLRARGEGPPARERSSGRGDLPPGRGAPSTAGRKPRERRGGGGRREAGYDGAVVPAADAARREKGQKTPGMQHPFGLRSFCRTGCGNRWRRNSALRFFNLQLILQNWMRQPLEEEQCASVLQFADAALDGVAAGVGLNDLPSLARLLPF